jgi:NADPH:quinone reductase-like Zn-dependent oxidoreductase
VKALTYHRYGSPEVLHYTDVAKPEPREGEVLVRVHAASINSWDWDLLTGRPLAFRLWGAFRPRYTIPGADVAGVVEALGPGVDGFAVGDEVFGDLADAGWGSFAEYVAAPVSRLARKSSAMSFEQAAACPQAGVLALVGLRLRPIGAGSCVLINGGGGGAGSFAIQMAKAAGAEVTAVDSAHKLEAMTKLGADRALDYTQVDYTELDERFDLIIDVQLTRSARAVERVLAPEGALGVVGGSPAAIFRLQLFGRRRARTMALVVGEASPANFEELNRRFEAGEFRPLIDRSWPLAEAAEAYRQFSSGEFCGKIVLTM